MFGHLLFFKENNIFDLIEMFKMRSAVTWTVCQLGRGEILKKIQVFSYVDFARL